MADLNKFSVQEILNRCFDGTDSLGVSSAGQGSAGAQRSEQEIWNLVFDDANDRLRLT